MSRYNRVKYINTMNLGRSDDNVLGLKLGDICHIVGSYVRANQYDYCGYPQFDVPEGAAVRIIGIKQTELNQGLNGNGDVYLDLELVDHRNPDGTRIRMGNRHAWCLREVSQRNINKESV